MMITVRGVAIRSASKVEKIVFQSRNSTQKKKEKEKKKYLSQYHRDPPMSTQVSLKHPSIPEGSI